MMLQGDNFVQLPEYGQTTFLPSPCTDGEVQQPRCTHLVGVGPLPLTGVLGACYLTKGSILDTGFVLAAVTSVLFDKKHSLVPACQMQLTEYDSKPNVMSFGQDVYIHFSGMWETAKLSCLNSLDS